MTNENPKVSIVLRSFNEQKHIGKLLREISKQETTFPFEVILVDSGSTDSTLEIAKEYKIRIEHIKPHEFTFGRSLNIGIKASLGEICVFTSSHCYPDNKKWLQNIVIPFYEDEKVALVYGMQRGVSSTKYSEHQIFAKWFPDFNIKDFDLPFCNNANSAIRKSVWEFYQYNESLTGLEDMDWARHIKKMNYKIDYKADACIRHVHEETAKQVYTRYYREAYAYKQIYPDQKFGLFSFFKFWLLNVTYDYRHAISDRVLLENFFSIITFRFLQFWGTYRANSYKTKMDKGLQKQLYYPRKVKTSNITNKVTPKVEYIDITKTLSSSLSVWPGNNRFERIEKKTFNTDGFSDSDIKFNIHTGTHMDAPYHFMEKGNTVETIDLNKMIGKVYVAEFSGERNIDLNFAKKIVETNKADRVIFKTLNSHHDDSQFNKNFIALDEDVAEYLSQNVALVGVDGPSVQSFFAKSNKTHADLLSQEVVIFEGLELKDVDEGWYNLLALPMKLANAEGAPIRAILTKESLV